MFRQLINAGLHLVDDLVVAADPRGGSGDVLVNVLFHSLCESPAGLTDPALAPGLTATVGDFRGFVEEMLGQGYTVVSPAQIDAGLEPGRPYLSITFDDGYFNNALSLEVLEQFRVPATFFVSTDHVLQGKAFWWDAFGRELARKTPNRGILKAEMERLKTWTPEKIDAFLCERFGPSVLRPWGDLDRPFTIPELKEFARSPWVHLGNHTLNHAILPNCTPKEMTHQIEGCQEALAQLVGYRPLAIAYPNGNVSPAAVHAASKAGLRLGFTVAPLRPKLPLAGNARMTLGRFIFYGGQDIRRQCRLFAARFVPSHAIKNLVRSSSY